VKNEPPPDERSGEFEVGDAAADGAEVGWPKSLTPRPVGAADGAKVGDAGQIGTVGVSDY
jgi:hypothetical protein